VSVGGLLALDQLLKNTWSYLTTLGLRQLAKEGAQCEAEIKEARPIFGSILGFWVDVMGNGRRPVGLPMLRPIL
jgi:hypothetical protein